MIKDLTFGSDPEYFVRNETTGMIVSSIPIIEGTKELPESMGDGYSILKDNILVEGNIPPARDKAGFIANMGELQFRLDTYIKARYPVLGLYHSDCEEVSDMFLSHPEALQFGCSPYLNAWDEESHRAKDMSDVNYRTAGFHIHIGYNTTEGCPWSKETLNKVITRAFDLFVIIPSCLVNVDRRRFENYGGLGQYRQTSYGLECRSLGAFFAAEKYIPWVFDQTLKAIEFVSEEKNLYKLMYMAKPNARFKSGIFFFESALYAGLEISLDDQLIPIKKTIHA
jgi:hypothetical protein